LARVIDQLRRNEPDGDAFHGMPYAKVKTWVECPLPDKRLKAVTRKKVVKTFRLDPAAIERLKRVAALRGCTETEVIEGALLKLGA
jgi:hypothetical protein